MEKEELIKKYLAYEEDAKQAKVSANNVLNELCLLAPHKKGEIVKWNAPVWEKVRYDWHWNSCRQQTGVVEKKAVLRNITIDLWNLQTYGKLAFRYEFSALKKDGTVAKNTVYPREGFEWTGEILSDLNDN